MTSSVYRDLVYEKGTIMQTISKAEFQSRVKTFQANVRKARLDAALVHGNECDLADARQCGVPEITYIILRSP